MYIIERLLKSNLVSYNMREYKTYSRAKKSLIKESQKKIKDTFEELMRANEITVIRDYLNHIYLTRYYDFDKRLYHFTEFDGIGNVIDQFDIKEGGSKNENK